MTAVCSSGPRRASNSAGREDGGCGGSDSGDGMLPVVGMLSCREWTVGMDDGGGGGAEVSGGGPGAVKGEGAEISGVGPGAAKRERAEVCGVGPGAAKGERTEVGGGGPGAAKVAAVKVAEIEAVAGDVDGGS